MVQASEGWWEAWQPSSKVTRSYYCEQLASNWDIKFNPDKSQSITFGGRNPYSSNLFMNGSPLMWVDKVKYLGTYIYSFSQRSDLSCNIYIYSIIRTFYGQFNKILSVLGKYPHEMATLHLVKSYYLLTLLYGCETWCVSEMELHKASVAWNNSFRQTFSCC